jgi:hypothetical protein
MMMKMKNLILIYLVVAVISGCSMEGSKPVTVVDNNGKQIMDVLVFPLYESSYGIGIGPDGKGLHFGSRVFTKQLVINSGDDLLKKQINSKGLMIPPLIYLGSSNYVGNYLFAKKGYAPQVVERYALFNEARIVMTKTENDEYGKVIDKFLAQDSDQIGLKRMFNAEHLNQNIQIVLDSKDIALLKANR